MSPPPGSPPGPPGQVSVIFLGSSCPEVLPSDIQDLEQLGGLPKRGFLLILKE